MKARRPGPAVPPLAARKRVAAAAVVLILWMAAAACGGKSPSAPSVGGGETVSLPALSEMVSEKALGSEAAPNTVIEYSAFNCSHCADFHSLWLPELKRKHIDTGNVRYILRDFPLDPSPTTSNAGLSAAMVARCTGNARYFDAASLLYSTRGSWSSNPPANLAAVMSSMLSQAEVSACLATTELRNAVLQSRATGLEQFGVSGTPTFIVNGNKVVGNLGLAALEAYFK
ncbi:MAG: thioredoxin domain-containing protein [Vicinamibacterales bacterium]